MVLSHSASSAFAELTQRLHASGDGDGVYQAIVDMAVDIVHGCDHASMMLLSRGTFITAAASDGVAAAVDELERAVGEGPCLDAILAEEPQVDTDLTAGSPWPKLAAATLELTPVRGAMGFRLLVDGRKAGTLNLFSDRPGMFDTQSVSEASVLVSFASVALMTVSARDQAGHLRTALESNREIGKAIGLLMAAHKVDEQKAFEILNRTSQDLNIKLAELAAQVVHGQQSQFARPAPTKN